MKRILLCSALLGALALTAVLLAACRSGDTASKTTAAKSSTTPSPAQAATTTPHGSTAPTTEPPRPEGSYETISQERAKSEMDALKAEGKPFILLDVRRQDEFDSGHIAGAMLLPNEEIGARRPEALPDLSVPIYVYCRSGNRSLQAAKKLAEMGYTVYDFGGITTWPYGTVTE